MFPSKIVALKKTSWSCIAEVLPSSLNCISLTFDTLTTLEFIHILFPFECALHPLSTVNNFKGNNVLENWNFHLAVLELMIKQATTNRAGYYLLKYIVHFVALRTCESLGKWNLCKFFCFFSFVKEIYTTLKIFPEVCAIGFFI